MLLVELFCIIQRGVLNILSTLTNINGVDKHLSVVYVMLYNLTASCVLQNDHVDLCYPMILSL